MQIDLTNIQNIIFDLGNVLLNLDFDASIKAFHKLNRNPNLIDGSEVYSDPVFYKLGTGQITPDEFRNQLRRILQNDNIDDEQLNTAWSAMILDVPENRVQMLKKLSKNYNIYLFSNTNQIHIDKLHREFLQQYQFEFPSLFVKDYYSHKIHEYKPEVKSYLKVIELADIKPLETLFIDDLEENIEGAKEAGLKTFWLKNGTEITTVL